MLGALLELLLPLLLLLLLLLLLFGADVELIDDVADIISDCKLSH